MTDKISSASLFAAWMATSAETSTSRSLIHVSNIPSVVQIHVVFLIEGPPTIHYLAGSLEGHHVEECPFAQWTDWKFW